MPDPSPNPLRAQRVVVVGLLINVALAATKLIAGLVGHSYALIADAIESIIDIVSSVVIWSGLHIGARPADERHPFGHGKAEALAALVVSTVIIAAGVGIAVEAVHEIITPHHAPAPFTLIVLVAVVIIKEILFRFVRAAARANASTAVEVDAWHHRADALTSAAAFVGISVALIGGPGWEKADDVAALAASVIILYNGWKLLLIPLHELMDADDPNAESIVIEPAQRVALTVHGVGSIEKIRARKSGSRYYLELHLQVDPLMSVKDAHVIAGKVRAAIRAALANVSDVLIHVEPLESAIPSEAR
ncbi:MAG TPA: cation diffusion facilitator family transporter [Phycisphaerales bacterium]|nr:cation diffusion facilitator family transporter [Phycisphaerales bacterium]